MEENVHETQKRVVTFLVDPKARFVSLVDHGANQIPFKIVKREKKMKKVLQAIIAPEDISKEEIESVFGKELKDVLKFDKMTERSNFKKYEQIPKDKFKEGSFELVVLDDVKKVMGIQGELSEEESGGIISRIFKKENQVKALEVEGATILPAEEVLKKYSFEVENELYTLTSALNGILSQEKGDSAKKLEMMRTVIENFVQFIEEAFSVTKSDCFILSKKEKVNEDVKKMKDEKKEPVLNIEEQPVEKKEENEPDKIEVLKAEIREEIEKEVKETVSSLQKKMEKIASLVEKLSASIPGTVEKRESEDPPAKMEKKEGVFSGIIFGNL